MRFIVGAIVLVLLSFGVVFMLRPDSGPEAPVDVIAVLETQPREYSDVYNAFKAFGDKEVEELDRSIRSFASHKDEKLFHKEVGGLVVRAVKENPKNLSHAGLPLLEKISREQLAQIRRYQRYGPDFCDVQIRPDYVSAEKILLNDLPDRDAEKIIADFNKERFELSISTLEAAAEGAAHPVPIPEIDHDTLMNALLAAGDERQDRIIEQFDRYDRDCEGVETMILVGLSIPQRDIRHAVLAQAVNR
ncbi:MAG TPA: hypothetical protein VK862_04940 [Afifellaceae bacterium]|nr:hypothetical protein [Afifellaceae bacterium]